MVTGTDPLVHEFMNFFICALTHEHLLYVHYRQGEVEGIDEYNIWFLISEN